MKFLPVSLDSRIEEKLSWARNCTSALKATMLEDHETALLLARLKTAIAESHAAMALLGIPEECRTCEETRGGSCCGLGLENYYSGILLLINMLLDVGIPTERSDPRSCFFLGSRGCRLAVRDVICINYLCEEITSRFSGPVLSELREKEGVEIDILFQLNERILGLLSAFEKEDSEIRLAES